jgi:hypothetical protein
MAKTVVILGASFAGLKIAHHLLKTTLPVVKDLKVVIVSPSTHLFWNIAAPRAIIPGQIPDEKIMAPYAPGFSKYPSSSYEIILGKATNVDPANKKVEIGTESGPREVAYDYLVVTTGSNSGDAIWKQSGSYKEFLERLHHTQDQVKRAKSIIIGGGGVTGVETAGELGFEYGKTKEITLVGHHTCFDLRNAILIYPCPRSAKTIPFYKIFSHPRSAQTRLRNSIIAMSRWFSTKWLLLPRHFLLAKLKSPFRLARKCFAISTFPALVLNPIPRLCPKAFSMPRDQLWWMTTWP